MRRIAIVATGLALGATVLAGCGNDTEQASEAYCASLSTAQSSISDLKSLIAGDATVDEIRDQAGVVSTDLTKLRDDRGDLSSEAADNVQAYYDDFSKSVSDIPGDANLSEAADQYLDAAKQLDANLAALASEISC